MPLNLEIQSVYWKKQMSGRVSSFIQGFVLLALRHAQRRRPLIMDSKEVMLNFSHLQLKARNFDIWISEILSRRCFKHSGVMFPRLLATTPLDNEAPHCEHCMLAPTRPKIPQCHLSGLFWWVKQVGLCSV